MKEFNKYVGLDVHKETIAVSVAEAGGGEVRYFGEIANTPEAFGKLVGQLKKGGTRLAFCYEAGAGTVNLPNRKDDGGKSRLNYLDPKRKMWRLQDIVYTGSRSSDWGRFNRCEPDPVRLSPLQAAPKKTEIPLPNTGRFRSPV